MGEINDLYPGSHHDGVRAAGGDMADSCLPDADFNQDGAVNGLDVETVEFVGGVACP